MAASGNKSSIAEAAIDAVMADGDAEITLGLLNAVEENSALTQRSAAADLGIALGLTNAYLKRCIRKGWIKVNQIPPNRYAYYLTPKGFAEKSSLTAEYLSTSFNFFRGAREQCLDTVDQCARRGWSRIALAGAGDLAEIALLCAADHDVTVVALVDAGAAGVEGGGRQAYFGVPVVADLADAGAVDAVIITDMIRPQDIFDRLAKKIGPHRVLTPRLLNISRQRPDFAAAEEGES